MPAVRQRSHGKELAHAKTTLRELARADGNLLGIKENPNTFSAPSVNLLSNLRYLG
jgi:hypothetical protein